MASASCLERRNFRLSISSFLARFSSSDNKDSGPGCEIEAGGAANAPPAT
eukprot:CAMPEP_0171949620 /NCGR_PEP_ID=MMETSP0993-20121228/74777_1 /TAXON_ID=483369 /ORGANISM="non described non described, Strain CCMP2098" /LENGTH=49 /DNA_ID= /DNA_START= /DNA_END= /DNA_ORIENTATION=